MSALFMTFCNKNGNIYVYIRCVKGGLEHFFRRLTG